MVRTLQPWQSEYDRFWFAPVNIGEAFVMAQRLDYYKASNDNHRMKVIAHDPNR